MHIDRTQVWHAALFTLRHIASAALILGIIGYLAKPHAQDFVRDAVDDRIQQLERQMNDVQRSMREQRQSQAVMSNEIGHLKDVQQDMRRDTRTILRSLQGMRRELRED